MSKDIGFRGSINVNGDIVLTNSASSFYINDKPVLSYNSLGDSIKSSKLTSVGTLSSLTVSGSTNVKNMTASNLFVDSITVTNNNNKTDNIIVDSGSIGTLWINTGTSSTFNINNADIKNLKADVFTIGVGNITTATLIYLNTNIQLLGTFVNSTTVTFASSWLSSPTGLPATSVNNFSIFCNGTLIELAAIVSFTQSSGTTTLMINSSELGYSFDSADEIIAIGKFSS
jgi:hypothetical protein